jgi:cell division protease FtsH
MSEELGPIAWGGQSDVVFLGKEFATAEKEYSEEVASKIDQAVSGFMKAAQKRATRILEKNRRVLDELARRLVEQESIERDEFERLMKEYGLKKEKK